MGLSEVVCWKVDNTYSTVGRKVPLSVPGVIKFQPGWLPQFCDMSKNILFYFLNRFRYILLIPLPGEMLVVYYILHMHFDLFIPHSS